MYCRIVNILKIKGMGLIRGSDEMRVSILQL